MSVNVEEAPPARDTTADRIKAHTPSRTKQTKIKPRSRQPASSSPTITDADLEDFVQKFKPAITNATDNMSSQIVEASKFLKVDSKFLDADAELRKQFGSIVDTDRNDNPSIFGGNKKAVRRAIASAPKRKHILAPKNNELDLLVSQVKPGLGMSKVSQADVIEFKLTHSRRYMEAQERFLETVQSYDPDMLLMSLRQSPFHIDTLLQASEYYRHQGDHTQGAELIERALFTLDDAMDPSFNISTGRVRLPFGITENRIFYLVLWKEIQNLGKRGCWRTCFEFTKLLLSLDPINDPYGVLLCLDFHAFRAGMHQYLVEFRNHWPDQAQIVTLPNIAFTAALSQWHLESKQKDNTHTGSKAALLAAAELFPYVIDPLLSGLGCTTPKKFQDVAPFSTLQDIYTRLYLYRSIDLWKAEGAKEFLLSAITSAYPRIIKPSSVHLIPRNVARHLIIEDERSLLSLVDPDTLAQTKLSTDPLPPLP